MDYEKIQFFYFFFATGSDSGRVGGINTEWEVKMRWLKCVRKNETGTVYVEEVVLLTLVAVGFAAATMVLGPALLDYHAGIELVLSSPIP